MAVWIDGDKCNGCGLCLQACNYGGVEISADGVAVLTDRCTACGSCLDVCRPQALLSDAGEREVPDFSDHTGVWVLAEQSGGTIHPVTFELIGKARELADELGEEVATILLGADVAALAASLIGAGADTVHLVEHDTLAHYLTRPMTSAATQVIKAAAPNILLVGATHRGRDLAPRLARRLGLGLTADCTTLAIGADKLLEQTRPAFGGNVMATIVGRYSRPQMASVRPGIMAALTPDDSRSGEIVRHDVTIDEADLGAVLIESMAPAQRGVDLTKAKIVVAGGRGIGDAAGFALLAELAEALGGELGGTRVAFEEGWIPYERQIGQTGVTIRPEIYIGCGISGAIQHSAGIVDSRYIIAINKDETAPIFKVADFALVGDFRTIVPALTRAVKGG